MKQQLTKREHLLLLAACAVGFTSAVYLPRIRPALQRAAALRERAAATEQQARETTWPRPQSDLAHLSERRDGLRAELASLRESLLALEWTFASRGGDALLDAQRLEISALAARHRITFREDSAGSEVMLRSFVSTGGMNAPAFTPGDEFTQRSAPRRTSGAQGGPRIDPKRMVRFLALGEPYALSIRHVVLETDFNGLRDFLRGLERLSHCVLVLRFELLAGSAYRPGPRPLLATLLLVY